MNERERWSGNVGLVRNSDIGSLILAALTANWPAPIGWSGCILSS
jgi:hypothetical protein